MQSEGFPFFLTRPLQLVNACVHDAAEAIIELLKHVGEMMKKKDRKRERKKERKKVRKRKAISAFLLTPNQRLFTTSNVNVTKREREKERKNGND